MTAPKIPRCEAESFNGIETRQCSRPVEKDRDGLPVCWQHARLARITAWNPNRRDDLPVRVVAPQTADQIVDRYKAAIECGTVIYAWEFLRPTQRDTDKAIEADFNAYVGGVLTDAVEALIDLGLTDGEIETRMTA